jgi:hypothetical protein
MHIHPKNKRIMPSLFSHAENKGCSIQRESHARSDEVLSFVTELLKTPKNVWLGVAMAGCKDVREATLNDGNRQVACVYDTAEMTNRAHAEICWNQLGLEEGDTNELRKIFMDLFQTDRPVMPQSYRDGAVWGSMPKELQDRKAI